MTLENKYFDFFWNKVNLTAGDIIAFYLQETTLMKVDVCL